MPCKTRPQGSGQLGQQQPPEACRKGLRFPLPIFHNRRAAAPGVGVDPPRHGPRAAGGSMSSAQQQRILGKPRLGLAGQCGQGSCLPLCLGQPSEDKQALQDDLAPVQAGSVAIEPGPGRGPLHANTVVPWALACTPFQSPPVHPSSLA